jgi:hypothetical protein
MFQNNSMLFITKNAESLRDCRHEEAIQTERRRSLITARSASARTPCGGGLH